MKLEIEVSAEQFERLAVAGQSYSAYGHERTRAAEAMVEQLISDKLRALPTPVLEGAPVEAFAG